MVFQEPYLGGKRYKLIKRIGHGGMGAVYEALDRLTQEHVALKRVILPTAVQQPGTGANLRVAPGPAQRTAPDYRLALAHEFRTLASLRHPHIISVLDYGFDADQQPFYTMELLRDAQTITQVATQSTFGEKIQLLLQVLQALAYLHRRGVIHRDIKPGNMLVASGQVKLLDFGLATVRDRSLDVDSIIDNDPVVGTLAYLAPEILKGAGARPYSDLYSVGMVAYEMFAGWHPFDTNNFASLIHDTLHETPDVVYLDVSQPIRDLVKRLLNKVPDLRYQTADDVMRALYSAADLTDPYETKPIRESYLQTARFVGREQELNELRAALTQTLSGQGSSWLIGGESGVGKSRLVDEMRAIALINGVQVVRGQASVNTTAPFALWRSVLANLALQSTLTELEATVLKPLVPDIENLVEFAVPDPNILDPDGTLSRLLAIVEEVMYRQGQPLLIILEDLQWAGQDLRILERLIRITSQVPIMILGTYRNDEMPKLPRQLPLMQLLTLERLAPDEIRALSTSILGEKAGQRDQVVDLLHKETEGNALFIVEVIRVLAEEAGQMDLVGDTTVPPAVFSQGIHSVIQRRLKRVPETDRFLLRIAAVMGRTLDLQVLSAINDNDLQDWLARCTEASVFDVLDDRWRFAHDKLRESVVADIPAEDRSYLHQFIAQAIEDVYPNDRTHTLTLAHHWRQAKQPERELPHVIAASELALSSADYVGAQQYAQRALELSGQLAVDRIVRAQLHARLGEAYFVQGEKIMAFDQMRWALESTGYISGSSGHRLLFATAAQALRQVMHRILPAKRFQLDNKNDMAKALSVSRLSEQSLLVWFWQRHTSHLMLATLLMVNSAERAEPSRELLVAYGNLAATVGIVSTWHSLAAVYIRLMEHVAQQIDDSLAEAEVTRGLLNYTLGLGKWDRAKVQLQKALQIARDTANYRTWGDCLTHACNVALFLGNLEEGHNHALELAEIAQRSGNQQHMRWSIFLDSAFLTYLEDYDAVISSIGEQIAAYKQTQRRIPVGFNIGIAQAYLRSGQPEPARNHALKIAESLSRHGLPSIYTIGLTYFNIAEVALALWEVSPDDYEMQALAQACCTALRKNTQPFPVSKPLYLIVQAHIQLLKRRTTVSESLLRRAIAQADAYCMREYEGIAYYLLARVHRVKNQQNAAMQARDEAQAIFKRLNIPYYLRRLHTESAD